MMKNNILISAVTSLAILAGAADVFAQSPQHSQFRQVADNGVGNCIFGPQVLPFGNEAASAYRARTEQFEGQGNVHVRCYFPSQLRGYERVGARYNSMRDRRKYYASLVWDRPYQMAGGGDYFVANTEYDYDSGAASADQQRFDLYRQSDCDFRYVNPADAAAYDAFSPHNCVNMAGFIREMAQRNNLSLPMDARFCVQVHIDAADEVREREVWDSNLGRFRTERDRLDYRHLIARSCFDYRVEA